MQATPRALFFLVSLGLLGTAFGFTLQLCSSFNDKPNECGSNICPQDFTTKCAYDTATGACNCPSEGCDAARNPDACKLSSCPTSGERCQWFFNGREGVCECPSVPLSCKEVRDKELCLNKFCDGDIPCAWYDNAVGGYCDCQSPPKPCRDIKNPQECGASTCEAGAGPCRWYTSADGTAFCDCPNPPKCADSQNQDICLQSVCPETNLPCVWQNEKCDCEPFHVDCAALSYSDECQQTACLDNPDLLCSFDAASRCSCTTAEPVECNQHSTVADCIVNTCLNGDGYCAWSDTTGCECPPKDCDSFGGPNECAVGTCIATGAQCLWNAANNRCHCPPDGSCASITDPDLCESTDCPTAGQLCRWESTQESCACVSEGCTFAGTEEECQSFQCPTSGEICQWTPTTSPRCNCATTVTTSSSTTVTATVTASATITNTNTGTTSAQNCADITDKEQCYHSACAGTDQHCLWYGDVDRCDCPPTSECDLVDNKEKCAQTLCKETQDRCIWSNSKCGCHPDLTTETQGGTTGVVYTECEYFLDEQKCESNPCPGGEAKCKWTEATNCCVDHPNKNMTVDCSAFNTKNRCNEVYDNGQCEWKCNSEEGGGKCLCDQCGRYFSKETCSLAACDGNQRCLWTSTNQCECPQDEESTASITVVSFTVLVAAFLQF